MDIQPYNEQFRKVVNIIESAKERAYRKVNEELITMYRDIGEYISKQSQNSSYGDAFVQKLADFFSENYPELKANTNFADLSEELRNTENKISFSRQFYNDSVTRYNTKLELFPSNLVAGMFNFQKKELFATESDEARKNVKVDFSNK